jgi:hypothetical protein
LHHPALDEVATFTVVRVCPLSQKAAGKLGPVNDRLSYTSTEPSKPRASNL